MPSSSKMAYTWAGDLSANRSLSSRASSAACPAAVSAAGCGARGPGDALPAAGRDYAGGAASPVICRAIRMLFTEVSGSSSVTAMSITCAASCLSPRSRRAVPRARALSPTTSSAALVRASSAVSFSFSRRSRSFSTASVLRPGRPARLICQAILQSRPRVLSASRRYERSKALPGAAARRARARIPVRRTRAGSAPCTPR